ncbi:MAG: DinB family protein [Isosphaeraceae bacterium]
MKSHIGRMLRAMAWADTQTLAALRDCPAAWADALGLFAHMLGAEHIWLARLQGSQASRPVWPTLSIPECEAVAAENAAGYRAYIEKLAESDLAKVVSYRNSKGEGYANTVLDILTHVVIHGAYHRGQIAKAIGRAGGKTADTDYIIFVRSVEKSDI